MHLLHQPQTLFEVKMMEVQPFDQNSNSILSSSFQHKRMAKSSSFQSRRRSSNNMEVIKVSFVDILKWFTVPSIHQWKVLHPMHKLLESKFLLILSSRRPVKDLINSG